MREPFVIWFTGLSSSGKTTLSQRVYNILNKNINTLILLDGDDVRLAFGSDLGYREKDRLTQIKRIQRISKMLVGQGISVIVAALYSHGDLLKWNRDNFSNYLEIFLDISVSKATGRDNKNLYAPAQKGKIKNVVGIDIKYHKPEFSDITIDMNDESTPEHIVDKIMKKISVQT